MTIKHPFQQWLDDQGVEDVRFYPQNPDESSTTELLNSALNAVQRYQQGDRVAYEDNTPEPHHHSA